MIGRRKSPDGLPFNLFMRKGKRITSFGYKNPSTNIWEFRLRAPTASAEKVARVRDEAIRRAMNLNGEGEADNTVAAWIKRYLDWQEGLPIEDERRKAQSTIDGNRHESKNLAAFFGEMLPSEVRAAHVYEFLDLRAENGAPVKANKEIALLSKVLEYCRRKGEIETNPVTDIEYNPSKPRTKLVTSEHLEFVVDVARERGGQYIVLALTVLAAYLLACRPQEIRRLHRSSIKAEGVEIPVGKRKRGQAQKFRLIRWSDKLRAAIDEAMALQRTSSVYIFGNTSGQPYSISGWYTIWRRLMTYCERKDSAFERFTLADMRPKAVTQRMDDGQSEEQVVNATGHSNTRMIRQTYDRRKTKEADATE